MAYLANQTNYTLNKTGRTWNLTPTETLDQTTTNTESSNNGFSTSAMYYQAQGITMGKTGNITKVSINMKKGGTPTMTLYVSIYSDNGSDTPNTRISDETSFDPSTLTTSYAWTDFTITNCTSKNSGDKVHVVVRASAYHGTNTAFIAGAGSVYAGGYNNNANNTPTWNAVTNRDLNVKTYVTGL